MNEAHQTADEITLDQIGIVTGGDQPDFPFANIKIQGNFDSYEIARQLQEKMDEQIDSFLLNARSQMEKNLSMALSLKANI